MSARRQRHTPAHRPKSPRRRKKPYSMHGSAPRMRAMRARRKPVKTKELSTMNAAENVTQTTPENVTPRASRRRAPAPRSAAAAGDILRGGFAEQRDGSVQPLDRGAAEREAFTRPADEVTRKELLRQVPPVRRWAAVLGAIGISLAVFALSHSRHHSMGPMVDSLSAGVTYLAGTHVDLSPWVRYGLAVFMAIFSLGSISQWTAKWTDSPRQGFVFAVIYEALLIGMPGGHGIATAIEPWVLSGTLFIHALSNGAAAYATYTETALEELRRRYTRGFAG